MATLRASRRSRTSRPIRFALLAIGFMRKNNKLHYTLINSRRNGQRANGSLRFKILLCYIDFYDARVRENFSRQRSRCCFLQRAATIFAARLVEIRTKSEITVLPD